MLASPLLPARGDTALRLASSAGEALPAELGERFDAHFGVDVIDGIGSTGKRHIYLSNRPGRVRRGSTSWPVPGYEVALRGDYGQPVADGETGDPCIRGPSATPMAATPSAVEATTCMAPETCQVAAPGHPTSSW
jgi:benzoate-CoA ligase